MLSTKGFIWRLAQPIFAHIEAWIDWNNNWECYAGEMVFNETAPSSGLHDRIAVTLPTNAVTGEQLGLRIRISHQNDMTSYRQVNSGEIEDYLLIVNCAPQTCIPINAVIMRQE